MPATDEDELIEDHDVERDEHDDEDDYEDEELIVESSTPGALKWCAVMLTLIFVVLAVQFVLGEVRHWHWCESVAQQIDGYDFTYCYFRR